MNSFFPDIAALKAALDMSSLLPDYYAEYRPVIKDCIIFFVNHLSPAARIAIINQQIALPRDCCVEDRFVTLIRNCPTLHKVGQLVARDRRLSKEFRTSLQSLESLPPATPVSQLTPLIQAETGNVTNLEISDTPLAEASVAVIVPFTWRDGKMSGSAPHEGVLKILKPGIEERLQEELEIWALIGDYLEERCAHFGIPSLDYKDTVERLRLLLANEILLDQEQIHMARAAEFYRDFPGVRIPSLFPWSTPKITAMEKIEGGKVTDIQTVSRLSRRELAECIVGSILAKPFWSDSEEAWFHADPHAGNLLYTPEGQLAILDWSLIVNLNKKRREQLMQLLIGGITFDEYRLCSALSTLVRNSPGLASLKLVAREGLRKISIGTFPGFNWLIELIEQLMFTGNATLYEDLVLFRKTLLSLGDVVADVSESVTTNRIMQSDLMQILLGEFAIRPIASYRSRTFSSHLSNEDILDIWTSWPFAATRFWIERWKAFLEK